MPETTPNAESSNGLNLAPRGEILAGILRERILQGNYVPGERLREVDIRKEFDLSNGPVREAFQTLVAQGLAERAPWRGVCVTELSERQIVELFQLRLALIQYAAERAALHASNEALSEGLELLKRLTDTIDAAKAAEGRLRFNGELSAWLLKAAGNKAIAEVWSNVVSRTQIYVNASMRSNAGSQLRPYIESLITAVARRDVETARNAARELTKQTLHDLGVPDDV
jgi:DNA-binding GntR family transcriptional regulator